MIYNCVFTSMEGCCCLQFPTEDKKRINRGYFSDIRVTFCCCVLVCFLTKFKRMKKVVYHSLKGKQTSCHLERNAELSQRKPLSDLNCSEVPNMLLHTHILLKIISTYHLYTMWSYLMSSTHAPNSTAKCKNLYTVSYHQITPSSAIFYPFSVVLT